MKTSLSKVAITVAVLLVIVGGAFSVPGTQTKKKKPSRAQVTDCSRIDESALTNLVKTKISDTELLEGQNINVEAEDGVITLRGNVISSSKKTAAARTAAGVKCVRRVVNLLNITLPFRDYECCCDGSCWIQSRPCPFCSGVKDCSEDYKAAVAAAHGNRRALLSAWHDFHKCLCKKQQ